MIILSRLKILYGRILDFKDRKFNKAFGSTDYKKFVIISDARTGSTLLMGLMNNHPEIIAMGEIFKQLEGRKTIDIWNDIFRSRAKEVKWVGFKLFYDHPWNSMDQKVWNLIEEDKNIVIIHLVRINKLRSYVSKHIGLKTKIWTDNIKKPNSISTDQKKVHVNSQDCIANLEKIEQKEIETRERYKRHKIIPVSYEELDQNKSRTMRRIFEELGVKNRIISTSMIKQNSEKLIDLITNYEELRSDLQETKWISYLNE